MLFRTVRYYFYGYPQSDPVTQTNINVPTPWTHPNCAKAQPRQKSRSVLFSYFYFFSINPPAPFTCADSRSNKGFPQYRLNPSANPDCHRTKQRDEGSNFLRTTARTYFLARAVTTNPSWCTVSTANVLDAWLALRLAG
jgi:hypothetical protein